MKKILSVAAIVVCSFNSVAQDTTVAAHKDTMSIILTDTTSIVVKGKTVKALVLGADQMRAYLTLIKGKSVAVVANQTSMVGKMHLVDTLLKLKIKIACVFAPEHGFRGESGAGEKIENSTDEKTGLPVISLYGTHFKPTKTDLANVDVVIFDIQDVGARFYTYISTLQYVMEACAEQNKIFILLDRPNPNGYYVDGPLMEKKNKSIVGRTPIPIVHGLTVAEYARMIIGEGWIKGASNFNPRIIKMKNYSHKQFYKLPVNPSPNLTSMKAVYLYPSLCWFEGTAVSVGRGSDHPFEQIGYPDFNNGDVTFTPKSKDAAPEPQYQDTLCAGWELAHTIDSLKLPRELNLLWLMKMYESYPDKKKFFTPYFDKLAGTTKLREQIQKGATEAAIRKSWLKDIAEYKKMRKRYLLYEDFEK